MRLCPWNREVFRFGTDSMAEARAVPSAVALGCCGRGGVVHIRIDSGCSDPVLGLSGRAGAMGRSMLTPAQAWHPAHQDAAKHFPLSRAGFPGATDGQAVRPSERAALFSLVVTIPKGREKPHTL